MDSNFDSIAVLHPILSQYLEPSVGQPVKEVSLPIIAVTGATGIPLVAPMAGSVAAATFVAATALAASNTNYLTFTLTDVTNSSAVMLAATAANTTQVTGGAAIAAYTAFPLTLTATGANLVVAKGDVLSFVCTPTGTLANTVPGAIVVVTFLPSL